MARPGSFRVDRQLRRVHLADKRALFIPYRLSLVATVVKQEKRHGQNYAISPKNILYTNSTQRCEGIAKAIPAHVTAHAFQFAEAALFLR
jgi:hypothetical protein